MSENHQQLDQNTAPAQGQRYIQQQYYQASEDEIDLRELFGVLWKGKWWIIGITALFAVASVFYALSLPNEYKAEAIVAPASESSGGGLNALAGQFGGLASLAGVNLGASESNDTVIAMELMKTWGFADEFIKKHNLQVALFGAKGWDANKKEFIFDEDVFDGQQWIRKPPSGKTVDPTSWELYEKYKESLLVSQDKDTGLIKIGFMSYSPEYSQNITQRLIQDVNAIMKSRALDEASKNISYLEGQISKTSLSDMQNIFYSLIEEQTKTKMLADVSDEFVFNYVSKARVPEVKSKPNRGIIVLAGLLFGFFISICFLIVSNYLRNQEISND